MNDLVPARSIHVQRVLLVDDHSLVRACVRRIVEQVEGFEVCDEAGTGATALTLTTREQPDLIVLDLSLPDIVGVDLIAPLKSAAANTRVLMLSMHDDPARVERAFAAGADGYLVKHAAMDELVVALKTLRAGRRYLYPPLGAAIARTAERRREQPLTIAQERIVRLVALGHTNAEIARQVHLSVRTVETHRAHVMSRLRCGDRAQLVRWALDHGLLSDAY